MGCCQGGVRNRTCVEVWWGEGWGWAFIGEPWVARESCVAAPVVCPIGTDHFTFVAGGSGCDRATPPVVGPGARVVSTAAGLGHRAAVGIKVGLAGLLALWAINWAETRAHLTIEASWSL